MRWSGVSRENRHWVKTMKITCKTMKLSDDRGSIIFSKEAYKDFQKALTLEGNAYVEVELIGNFAKVTKV